MTAMQTIWTVDKLSIGRENNSFYAKKPLEKREDCLGGIWKWDAGHLF
jgi:hypothetical protein